MAGPQNLRIASYVYIIFVESVASHWITSVMPVVASENLGARRDRDKSGVASDYFVYFFLGMIAGSFIWPLVVRILPKRECMVVGLFLQALSNYLVGVAPSMGWLCFWRFWFGVFHLSNSVSKDFLYDFADHTQRQSIFVMRSVAILISSFLGPLFGYYLYYGTGMSLAHSLAIISLFYLSAIFFFALAFYCFPMPSHAHDVHPDELQRLRSEDSRDAHALHLVHPTQVGVWPMAKFILRRKDLRNTVLSYYLIFAVYCNQLIITVFYIETPWKAEGLGLSDREVSFLVLAVLLPIVCLFWLSNLLVPYHIGTFTYVRAVVWANIILQFLLPGLRDLAASLSPSNQTALKYMVVSLFFTCNPNLSSPFLNVHMNNQIPHNARTTFNSITNIGLAVCALVGLLTVVPLFSRTMFDPVFTQHAPYSKYLCFAILNLILGAALLLLPKTSVPKH